MNNVTIFSSSSFVVCLWFFSLFATWINFFRLFVRLLTLFVDFFFRFLFSGEYKLPDYYTVWWQWIDRVKREVHIFFLCLFSNQFTWFTWSMLMLIKKQQQQQQESIFFCIILEPWGLINCCCCYCCYC